MSFDLSFDKRNAILMSLCLCFIAALLVATGLLLGMSHARCAALSLQLPASTISPSPIATPLKVGPASLPTIRRGKELEAGDLVATPTTTFSLQFGSFRDQANAEEQVKKLKSEGITATVLSLKDSEGRTWFTVRSGAFANLTDAVTATNKLKESTHQLVLIRSANRP